MRLNVEPTSSPTTIALNPSWLWNRHRNATARRELMAFTMFGIVKYLYDAIISVSSRVSALSSTSGVAQRIRVRLSAMT